MTDPVIYGILLEIKDDVGIIKGTVGQVCNTQRGHERRIRRLEGRHMKDGVVTSPRPPSEAPAPRPVSDAHGVTWISRIPRLYQIGFCVGVTLVGIAVGAMAYIRAGV